MQLIKYIKKMLSFVKNGSGSHCNYTTVVVKEVQPNHLLENKKILITGGGRGLGYYIAKRSIAEGAHVVISGRNEESLKKAATELGKDCEYIVFNVQNTHEIENFILEAEKTFDGEKVDCLVSNAGISLHEGNFRNVTPEGWDSQFDTNLKGNYFMTSKFVQYLEKQDNKKGNIVVITSERAQRSDDIPYGLTKTATNSFIKCIASKVIDKGIRINGVGPGVTASDMTGFQSDGNMYAEWQPQKRIFMPEEVAEVVNFLLSDASSCISGEIITCDQGRYISTW